MMKLLSKFRQKIRFPGRRQGLLRDEKGQSLIILAFAFVGLVAMLGLALDLGLVYIERVRLKRTIDAAALAAVTELPQEEEASLRAIDYLSQNGYNILNSNVYVAGCVQDIRGVINSGSYPNLGGTDKDDLVNLPIGTVLDTLAPLITNTIPISDNLFYPYITVDPPTQPHNASVPTFYIDLRSYQTRGIPDQDLCDITENVDAGASSLFGSANKMRIYGEVPVRMNFMQFFGFKYVTVSDEAVAENSSSLDVAVVLDRTGSMRFDTICYGCWARCGDDTYPGISNDTGGNNATLITPAVCNNDERYLPFPNNGRAFPYDYDGVAMETLMCGNGGDCSTNPITPGEPKPVTLPGQGATNKYIIMEAEFYTYNNAHDQFPAAWNPAVRTAGRGYWALQRNKQAKAYSVDGYGYVGTGNNLLSGFVRHHPYIETADNGIDPFGRFYDQNDAINNDQTPRLEYQFIPDWTGDTYVYMRAQWFTKNGSNNPTPIYNQFFWVIDTGTPIPDTQATAGTSHSTASWYPDNKWQWIRLNAGSVTPSTSRHTLNIWASSVGYAIDRIIITNDPNVLGNTTVQQSNATPGSAQGVAADPCNPIFGLTVLPSSCTSGLIPVYEPVNNLNDPLFSGLQPIRGAQEAVKRFVARLNPQLDQAGFVSFSDDAEQQAQLECLIAARDRKAAGAQIDDYPIPTGTEYDETACFDPDEAAVGTVPISYTNVFVGIENVYPPDSNTDIADGLRRALHLLGVNTDNDDGGNHANDCAWTQNGGTWKIGNKTQPSANVTSHCARGQAATPVIVILTDGAPTNGDPGDDNDCIGPRNPLPYEGFPNNDKKYQCIMYYTEIAAQRGVIIYTIGLGPGADKELLRAVAQRTSGEAYFVLSASQLDQIFDQILGNIYVRLVQ